MLLSSQHISNTLTYNLASQGLRMILPKITKLRTFQVPPKSTNNLYFHIGMFRVVKSYGYKRFRAAMSKLIDRTDGFLPEDMSNFGLYIEVGVCEEFDLDNTLKGIIDALQEAYGFNDNQIRTLIAKKHKIGEYPLTDCEKRQQYVRVGLLEFSAGTTELITQNDLDNLIEPERTIVPNKPTQDFLLGSVAGDQIELVKTENGDINWMEIAVDLEKVAQEISIDQKILEELGDGNSVEAIRRALRETEKDTKLIPNAAKKLGVKETSFRTYLHNRPKEESPDQQFYQELEKAEPWIEKN